MTKQLTIYNSYDNDYDMTWQNFAQYATMFIFGYAYSIIMQFLSENRQMIFYDQSNHFLDILFWIWQSEWVKFLMKTCWTNNEQFKEQYVVKTKDSLLEMQAVQSFAHWV